MGISDVDNSSTPYIKARGCRAGEFASVRGARKTAEETNARYYRRDVITVNTAAAAAAATNRNGRRRARALCPGVELSRIAAAAAVEDRVYAAVNDVINTANAVVVVTFGPC